MFINPSLQWRLWLDAALLMGMQSISYQNIVFWKIPFLHYVTLSKDLKYNLSLTSKPRFYSVPSERLMFINHSPVGVYAIIHQQQMSPMGKPITPTLQQFRSYLMFPCIRMTSQCARQRLQSPASRLFTQPLIQTQIKENIKAPRHWPLCGEFTGERWIPRINGQ